MTTNPPTEWIDPDTGHRVIQLSPEPGSQSLYFNLNAFTPDGQKMVITTPNGISAINLKTRAIEKIVDGRAQIIMVGRKTGQVYYSRNDAVYATDPDTKATREIATLPPGGRCPRSTPTKHCWREPSPVRTVRRPTRRTWISAPTG